MRCFVALVSVLLAAHPALCSDSHRPANVTGTPIADRYRADARRIVQTTLTHNDAWKKLEHLCLRIGNRLSGSQALDHAIAWAIETMKADGQENVHGERVMIPHWVRGRESATMLKPRVDPLHILGLGGSVGTPPQGITAPVLVVKDIDELERIGDEARGKIVLFNYPMPPYDIETGSGYGKTVRYRYNGARWAAEHGGVAALVRSVTATSLRSPHTGVMNYGNAEVKVPAAAVTIEDAETIAGLQRLGVPVVVNLKMDAKTLPDVASANVIAELRGREKPEEVVVMGGHIDSWDVGQGAHDDGAGSVMAMEAINVLRKLEMRPRRTIRVVLWTNEENGLAGGKAYAADHADELGNHVAAIESDSGGFKPKGYSVACDDDARSSVAAEQLRDVMTLFEPAIGKMSVSIGFGGADVGAMKPAGVMLMGHNVEGSTYFDYHHTHADTLDKVDPRELSENVAVLAATVYILADMPDRLGERAAK